MGKRPSIRKMIPYVTARVEEKILSFKDEAKKGPTADYFAGRFALLQRLVVLDQVGYGDEEALSLVSLGACGYVSLAKAPDLIGLGVIDQDMYGRVGKVVREVDDWLVAE